MDDRTVHGVCEDGREIVRYDRRGRWYIEVPDGERRIVSLSEAAAVAIEAQQGSGKAILGARGGRRFDILVVKALGREFPEGSQA